MRPSDHGGLGDAMVRGAAPALFAWRDAAGALRLLPVLRARGRRLTVIGPDLRTARCDAPALRDALARPLEAPVGARIDRMLDAAGLPPASRSRARRAMVDERLAAETVGGCWLLRPPADAPFLEQVRHARVPARLRRMVALLAALAAMEIAGWATIGAAALDGHLDFGWLVAWVLMLASLVPLKLLARAIDAGVSLELAALMKRRMFAGALAFEPDRIRALGSGGLLGRVVESQALESLALGGGLGVLAAAVELAFAAAVLATAPGGGLLVALLAGWLVPTAWLAKRHWTALRRWTTMRLAMTNDLVERMAGHRTVLAQEPPARRADADDRAMQAYVDASRACDRSLLPLAAWVPAGWMLLGLAGLVPAFVAGDAGPAGLAIGLGGVLLASRGFGGLASGLGAVVRAAVSWVQVGELLTARRRADERPGTFGALADDGAARRGPLVEASGLGFRHAGAPAPTLHDAELRIGRGERILLQGASGSGKSTLAALLAGLRRPDSGVLLLGGLDRPTLGDDWHALATAAPQFHENHVFSAPLAFNLLMGRRWPPSPADLEEARALCEDLGLGELLARMPSGLMQPVGETGWQLSHGERSRVFLARALLQRAPLTLLDESFAALDPDTLRRCLACAHERADTLMVVAHP